jgi:prepilin-type N-terminal cleavage/methylation domain-containing protein
VTRRRARRSLDDGFTLTELVVVMFILGVVLAVVQTTMVMTSRTVSDNNLRVSQTEQARAAMDAMSRSLRTAVLPAQLGGTCSACNVAAFVQATSTSVQFYADVDNDQNLVGPSRVTYVVTASGDLTETVQPPDAHAPDNRSYTYCAPGPGCPVVSRVLARNVQATSPVFAYYDRTGAALAVVPLTAAELAAVDSVDLVLTVRGARTQHVNPVTVTERVTLPNADAVAPASGS